MTDPARLANATLSQLPAEIRRPGYDRAAIRPGIVHLGVGAFHRAHQAAFTDDCLAAGEHDWGITAASLRSADTRNALGPQDGLYTLAQRSTGTEALRVIGAIGQVLVGPESPAALLAALAAPATRIVSLTITEKGYGVDIASGSLRAGDPDIAHDLANPDQPRSALGFLVQALAMRRAAGLAPFTVLSCDNLSHNGRVLHAALTAFARARAGGLADFIADQVACPSTMVDRIVPATTDADRNAIALHLGLRDAWPVLAEPFGQWVIEDRFARGRPGWERAGVEFAADVAPFEAMKLRLLNGAHSALAAMGRLAGAETVAQAMAMPLLRAFVAAYWAQVIPTIPPPIDAAAYTHRLVARFDNVALQHRLAQIATDGSQKVPLRTVAALRDLRSRRLPHDMVILAVAAWIRSTEGVDDQGGALPVTDPVLAGWTGKPDPADPPEQTVERWLAHGPVFGPDHAANRALAPALTAALTAIRHQGVLAAVRAALAGCPP